MSSSSRVAGVPPLTLYRRTLLEAAPRLLGQLDREALSPTWGSFDRDHWAWKFRDFPINMLQVGLLPLSWLYQRAFDGNPYAGNRQLQHWLCGGLDAVLARQHRNGAFDTVGPFTQDHGVTLAMVNTVTTLLGMLGTAISEERRRRAHDAVARACTFAARSEEDYAFISNHQSLFALAWLRAGTLLDDDTLIARADATVDEIVRQQSADGWYREYGGPDPGYESLGILYLSLFRRARPHSSLDASLGRALEFYAHCLHPDGSLGGGYGSRHTSLWYPGGFELLAPDFPVAGAAAAFLRSRLASGNVVTPATVDNHNLASLLYGYAVAADAAEDALQEAVAPRNEGGGCPLLPCETPEAWRVFHESGLVVAATPHYYALTSLQKGGALIVFDRSGAGVAYEDSGYVIRAKGEDWSSSVLGATGPQVASDGVVSVETTFGLARREVLTPFKFLILRVLNLTVFRSVTLGALVRRMIIARLVTRRVDGPFRLERRVAFEADRVDVQDGIWGENTRGVTGIWRPRAYTAVHMGSARYFSARDLDNASGGGDAWMEPLGPRLAETGRVRFRLVLSFGEGLAPRLHHGDVNGP